MLASWALLSVGLVVAFAADTSAADADIFDDDAASGCFLVPFVVYPAAGVVRPAFTAAAAAAAAPASSGGGNGSNGGSPAEFPPGTGAAGTAVPCGADAAALRRHRSGGSLPLTDAFGHSRIVVRHRRSPAACAGAACTAEDVVVDVVDDTSYVHVCPPEEDPADGTAAHGGHLRSPSRAFVFETLLPASSVLAPSGRGGSTSTFSFLVPAVSPTDYVSVTVRRVRANPPPGSAGGVGGGAAAAFSPVSDAAGARARAAAVLQDAAIEHTTIQSSGPVEAQNNIVFLSGGYTAEDRWRFDSDVREAVEFMKIPSRAGGGFAATVSFARYASLLNIFSVYQPSAMRGAHHPSSGTVVDNNLDCTYGDVRAGSPERMLSCNMEKVTALAGTAPCGALGKKNVVVVTLIYSARYGGAGLYHRRSGGTVYRQASFFNGYLSHTTPDGVQKDATDTEMRNFASLFFHEVGHAYANLFDEYNFGASSRGGVVSTPNCENDLSKVRWGGWIQEASMDQFRTVSAQPVPVCGFTDYFRPSKDCIMDKLSATRLCPVCREASVLAFYENGMATTNPRCPQEGEVSVLEPGEHLYLYVNKRLTTLGAFAMQWRYAGTNLTPPHDPSALRVEACSDPDLAACTPASPDTPHLSLPMGVHEFTLTVEDQTDWVLVANRLSQMRVSTTYTVQVVPPRARASLNTTQRDCHTGLNMQLFSLGGDGDVHHSFCAADKAKVCEVAYTATPYQQVEDLSDLAKSVEGYLFGIVGAVVGGMLFMFLIVWCYLARENAKRAKCIFKEERPRWLEMVRWIMIVSAVLCMLSATVVIVLGMVSYKKLGAIGQLLMFGALALTLVLFLIAFVGFTAAWYRSKCALTINGGLLVFCATVAVALTTFAFIFHGTVQQKDSWAQTWIEDIWVWLADNHDKMLCSLEHQLECSGYFTTCQRLQTLKYCPENCESTHAQAFAVNACEPLIKGKFEDNFFIIAFVSVGLSLAMVLAVLFNFLLRRSLGLYKKNVQENFMRRPSYVQKRYVPTRKASMRYGGAFTPGDGMHDDSCDQLLALIGSLTIEERELLKVEFHRINERFYGDGKLTPPEFRFFLQTALAYKATEAEVHVLFKLIDDEGTGKISFDDLIDALGLDGATAIEDMRRAGAAYDEPMSPTGRGPARDGELSPGCPQEFGSVVASSHSSPPPSQQGGGGGGGGGRARTEQSTPEFATEWAEARDTSGKPYYFNMHTRETTRELWATAEDPATSRVYYWNRLTGEATLKKPSRVHFAVPRGSFEPKPSFVRRASTRLGFSFRQRSSADVQGGAAASATGEPPRSALKRQNTGGAALKNGFLSGDGRPGLAPSESGGSCVSFADGATLGAGGMVRNPSIARLPNDARLFSDAEESSAWVEVTTNEGSRRYWWNRVTGETSEEKPDPNWMKAQDGKGRDYWWNRNTGKTSYTNPVKPRAPPPFPKSNSMGDNRQGPSAAAAADPDLPPRDPRNDRLVGDWLEATIDLPGPPKPTTPTHPPPPRPLPQLPTTRASFSSPAPSPDVAAAAAAATLAPLQPRRPAARGPLSSLGLTSRSHAAGGGGTRTVGFLASHLSPLHPPSSLRSSPLGLPPLPDPSPLGVGGTYAGAEERRLTLVSRVDGLLTSRAARGGDGASCDSDGTPSPLHPPSPEGRRWRRRQQRQSKALPGAHRPTRARAYSVGPPPEFTIDDADL